MTQVKDDNLPIANRINFSKCHSLDLPTLRPDARNSKLDPIEEI